jgi:hypothetical protein
MKNAGIGAFRKIAKSTGQRTDERYQCFLNLNLLQEGKYEHED